MILYRNIAGRLESDLAKGYLSQFSHDVIISLIHKVMYKMNVKRSNIKKLAASYMKQDSSLTEKEAVEMARAILE